MDFEGFLSGVIVRGVRRVCKKYQTYRYMIYSDADVCSSATMIFCLYRLRHCTYKSPYHIGTFCLTSMFYPGFT